ncbi:hypothetical protein [Nocardioides sp. TF02-7]|uniref:sensor histidine kinase n=1 Tax=Nocardioides sp. TF02-7 TaxID=2917724 RepID=UPI001F0562A7|nr:hypothetical protein [Nocardioides sp. TF02-7]UMG91858.1 hypothetical protein MF408_17705 [Nocardioides sp. TF02-7]
MGPTRVEVGIRHDGEALEVRVTDRGPCADHPVAGPPGDGRGIHGMRERCELLGGRLEAGPVEGAGFEVRAVLPLGVVG